MTTTATEDAPFVHPALFYRGDQEYVAGTVPFLLEGLAASEPVAVAAPVPRLELIAAALGTAADAVHFVDMTRAGRNPGRIIPSVLRAFADARRGGHVRIIGEPIWSGRTASEYPACVQHEALINAAFRGRDVTILCPYDARSLPDDVLADAHATHPVLITAGRQSVSGAYDPLKVLDRYNEPLLCPPGAATVRFDAEALPVTRDFALQEARERGMGAVRLQDLALVVAELTTNSVVHAGGGGTLRLWAESEQIVCEVQDAGRLTDPLVGRRPAPPDQLGGRGLLLVHHLSDLVRVHTDEHGTTIRSYVARA
ncbi:sensor histidine kinase [Streptomyces sp. ActVer]|uniref:sensor histidine kinase n=1 Tax=Streptomyces sp. ActVer TaxID=3014558 RepID=UPI0022B5C971|nr:sensor histidine kinase [Streptomyces sp. ActVer]MCZ4507662.1 sensor histidine kinase [Streptomyces sp. ActVer]